MKTTQWPYLHLGREMPSRKSKDVRRFKSAAILYIERKEKEKRRLEAQRRLKAEEARIRASNARWGKNYRNRYGRSFNKIAKRISSKPRRLPLQRDGSNFAKLNSVLPKKPGMRSIPCACQARWSGGVLALHSFEGRRHNEVAAFCRSIIALLAPTREQRPEHQAFSDQLVREATGPIPGNSRLLCAHPSPPIWNRQLGCSPALLEGVAMAKRYRFLSTAPARIRRKL